MKELPNPIRTKLESIVQDDDYVRVSRFPNPNDWGRHQYVPPPPSRSVTYSDFQCQLRDDAALALQKIGIQNVMVDNSQVALRGVAYLNELIEQGRDCELIVRVLRHLRGNGASLWKEINAQRDKYSQFSALFHAWDEAKRLGHISQSDYDLLQDSQQPNVMKEQIPIVENEPIVLTNIVPSVMQSNEAITGQIRIVDDKPSPISVKKAKQSNIRLYVGGLLAVSLCVAVFLFGKRKK